jgi:hypothetical protein
LAPTWRSRESIHVKYLYNGSLPLQPPETYQRNGMAGTQTPTSSGNVIFEDNLQTFKDNLRRCTTAERGNIAVGVDIGESCGQQGVRGHGSGKRKSRGRPSR